MGHINPDLLKTVILFGASIAIVPLFKKLGLGTVLGYLVAGFLVGPFGFNTVTDPESIVHFAELGVVMFLFIIGLEMEPKRLWSLRKDIFGMSFLQVSLCSVLTTLAGIYLLGFSPSVAFIAGAGFVLSSTAIIMQVLSERGLTASPKGQRIFSTLLFEDMAIVPLLAAVAFLSPQASELSEENILSTSLIALIGVLFLVLSGKWLLNPLFRMISRTHIRELMTGTALFVVLGAAIIMEASGLSMAMGAFVAGIMLSESSFRNQLEADIEPFKGLLLGLFFMGVGMSLNLNIIANNTGLLFAFLITYISLKALSIFLIAKLFRRTNDEIVTRVIMMSHGGEFAFVLLNTATISGLLNKELSATLVAAVIISMIFNPIFLLIAKIWQQKKDKKSTQQTEQAEISVDLFEQNNSNILIIGFGRFSHVVSQILLAQPNLNVTIIDNNVNMIQAAYKFGFKVFYGDGTNPNSLHACGIEKANIVLVCTENPTNNIHIVKYIKEHHPLIKVMALAKDRMNALELVNAQVDYYIKGMFESSLEFSRSVLRQLGFDEETINTNIKTIRELDRERFAEEQLAGKISSDLAKKYMEKYKKELPEPYIKPNTEAEALSAITELIVKTAEKAEQEENTSDGKNKLEMLHKAEDNITQTKLTE